MAVNLEIRDHAVDVTFKCEGGGKGAGRREKRGLIILEKEIAKMQRDKEIKKEVSCWMICIKQNNIKT